MTMLKEGNDLADAIERIYDYFSDRADASCEPGDDRFRGNREMELLADAEALQLAVKRLSNSASQVADLERRLSDETRRVTELRTLLMAAKPHMVKYGDAIQVIERIDAAMKEVQSMNAVTKPEPTVLGEPIALSDLPRIGAVTDDGKFAGIARGEEHDYALYDLGRSEKQQRFTWNDARAWCAERGGDMASRAEGRLLAASIDLPEGESDTAIFWMGEQSGNANYAWIQYFVVGGQSRILKDYTFRARAVRRRPIR